MRDLLAYVLIYLLGLRMVSEGFDFYTGAPSSVVLTALLAFLAAALAVSSRMPKLLGGFLFGAVSLLVGAIFSFVANTSVAPAVQAEQLVKYIAYCALFAFAATHRWQAGQMQALARVFMAVTLLECAISLWQVTSGHGWRQFGDAWNRAFGLSSHPIMLGYKMVGMMVFLYCFGQFISDRARKVFYVAAVLTLYLTLSRAAWIFAALWLLFIWMRDSGLTFKALLIFVGVPVIGLLFYSTGRFDSLASLPEFIERGGYQSFDWRMMHDSYEWRLTQWYGMIHTGLERPWLGHGLGVSASLNQFDIKSHNSFIDFFVEGGLLGVTSFLIFIASLCIVTGRALRFRVEGDAAFVSYRASARALLVGSVAIMAFASSMFNNLVPMCLVLLDLACFCNVPLRRGISEGVAQECRLTERRKPRAASADANTVAAVHREWFEQPRRTMGSRS